MDTLVSDICIIDVEASGLHIDSYPIEVAVFIHGETHSWLIKPADEWVYWSLEAEAIHGISRQLLNSKGLEVRIVANALNEVLEKTCSLLYSDAVQWDSEWLRTLYEHVDIPQMFQVASIYEILPETGQTLFQESFKLLAESGKYQQHRAEHDVLMIHEAYLIASNINNKL